MCMWYYWSQVNSEIWRKLKISEIIEGLTVRKQVWVPKILTLSHPQLSETCYHLSLSLPTMFARLFRGLRRGASPLLGSNERGCYVSPIMVLPSVSRDKSSCAATASHQLTRANSSLPPCLLFSTSAEARRMEFIYDELTAENFTRATMLTLLCKPAPDLYAVHGRMMRIADGEVSNDFEYDSTEGNGDKSLRVRNLNDHVVRHVREIQSLRAVINRNISMWQAFNHAHRGSGRLIKDMRARFRAVVQELLTCEISTRLVDWSENVYSNHHAPRRQVAVRAPRHQVPFCYLLRMSRIKHGSKGNSDCLRPGFRSRCGVTSWAHAGFPSNAREMWNLCFQFHVASKETGYHAFHTAA